MDWKKIVRERLVLLRLPPQREGEIVEELALHLEAVYEAALADGVTETEAQAQALRVIAEGQLLAGELSHVEQATVTRWVPTASVEYLEHRGVFHDAARHPETMKRAGVCCAPVPGGGRAVFD